MNAFAVAEGNVVDADVFVAVRNQRAFVHRSDVFHREQRVEVLYGDAAHSLHGSGDFKTAEYDKACRNEHHGFFDVYRAGRIAVQSTENNPRRSQFEQQRKNEQRGHNRLFYGKKTGFVFFDAFRYVFNRFARFTESLYDADSLHVFQNGGLQAQL